MQHLDPVVTADQEWEEGDKKMKKSSPKIWKYEKKYISLHRKHEKLTFSI